jgi:hypothetical protein
MRVTSTSIKIVKKKSIMWIADNMEVKTFVILRDGSKMININYAEFKFYPYI